MLQTELASHIRFDRTYSDAISFLASNTINRFKDKIIKTVDGNDTMDVSQVCCGMCEKPLGNEMRMLFAPQKGSIAMVKYPNVEAFEGSLYEDVWKNSFGRDLQSFVLLCGDCLESFRTSMYGMGNSEFERDGQKTKDYFSGQLKKMDGSVIDNHQDLLDVDNYIFPHRIIEWDEELNDEMGSEVPRRYSPSECFVYTKRVAWIRYIEQGEIETDFRLVDEAFESSIFVEPNPNLPEPIRIRALNTIRLFKLNGLYYDYRGDKYHAINFIVNRNQTPYDDLRRVGRDKAHQRAQTARNQLKNARDLFADEKTRVILEGQQKIIMELNGFRSVWAKVFNDGDDPDGLAGLFGFPVPVPVTPTVVLKDYESAELNRLKGQIVDLTKANHTAQEINNRFSNYIGILRSENSVLADQMQQLRYSNAELANFIQDLAISIDDYAATRAFFKKREIKRLRKTAIIDGCLKRPVSSSTLLREIRQRALEVTSHRLIMTHS